MYFPVRNHSYLPADRSKSGKCIEKKILGKDWELYDWKNFSTVSKKADGIQEAKRIVIRRVNGQCNVAMESFYRSDSASEKTYIKRERGHSINKIKYKQSDLHNRVDFLKLQNSENLWNHYRQDWRNNVNFKWYKELIET